MNERILNTNIEAESQAEKRQLDRKRGYFKYESRSTYRLWWHFFYYLIHGTQCTALHMLPPKPTHFSILAFVFYRTMVLFIYLH